MSVASAELIRMLQVSEEALLDATCGRIEAERRVAQDVAANPGLHAQWKSDMRQHLKPAAASKSPLEKVRELRHLGIGLEHQRALIDHLRRSSITGSHRERLMAGFFRGLDYENAIVREHRRFRLAVAGEIALDRLLLLAHDDAGRDLLLDYRARYAHYFGLYCDWLPLRRGAYADIMLTAMLEARRDADEWRRLVLSVRLPRPRRRRFAWRRRQAPPAVVAASRSETRH